ncbi:MAG: helix-turn-helix transcriptional regulator [Clostridia bacterium]|nr:helix-turn-helix transcriptional regulator [Clostridia bacterium]
MYKKNEYAIKVGKNLKEARILKGLTQKEIAAEFRFTQQQYSRFESGVSELNYEQILALCKRFDITPNDLFDYYF